VARKKREEGRAQKKNLFFGERGKKLRRRGQRSSSREGTGKEMPTRESVSPSEFLLSFRKERLQIPTGKKDASLNLIS